MKIEMFNDFTVKRNSGVELECSKPACDVIQHAFDKKMPCCSAAQVTYVSSRTFFSFVFSGVYQVTL